MIDPRTFPKAWGAAVSSGNPDSALELYAPSAVLVPTYGASILLGRKEIAKYMGQFMSRPNLRVSITQLFPCRTGPTPVVSGFYSFVWGSGGAGERAAARFTFVLAPARTPDGRVGWKIITHHSSVVP
jgi:uncharacterized protein (TIGR02246 family)